MKIYILHYRCGSSDERVTCNQNACDLCINHNKTFYEEKEVNKDLKQCVYVSLNALESCKKVEGK